MVKNSRDNRTRAELLEEIDQLRARLDEAEQTLDAIRSGEVDALVVAGPQGDQIFSLSGAERTYRLIIETMNEAALTVDLAGTILFCNQRFSGLVKCPMAEIIGRKLATFAAFAQQSPLQQLLACAQAGPMQQSLTLRASDGTAVSVQLAASPLVDTGNTSICLVASDLTELEEQADSIRVLLEHQQALEEGKVELQAANAALHQSRLAALNVSEDAIAAQRQAEELASQLLREIGERRQAEQALSESESLFRALFENSLDAVLLTIPDGRVLSANPAACTMFGMAEEEIIRAGRAGLCDPDDPRPATALEESKRARRLDGVELEFIRKNGERFPAEVDSVILPGESQRSFVIIRDITERKQAEERLIKVNEGLETLVSKRTQDLAGIIEKLRLEIVDREKAEERVQRLNRLYAVLSATSQAIVRTKDREALFNDFCRIAVENGSFKLAWVGLMDEESGELKLAASAGATGYLEDIRITVNEEPGGLGPTGITVREGSYYVCNDFLGSSITRPWHEQGRIHGIRASASIALKQEGRVVGALTLYADQKDFFDSQHVELIQQMGADVSFALDIIVREGRRQEAEQALREETAERLQAEAEVRTLNVELEQRVLDRTTRLQLEIAERQRAEELVRASLTEKEVMLREIHHRVKNNLQVISSLVSLQAANLTDERMRDEFNDVRDRVRSMALIHEKLYQTSDLARLNFADYAASLLSSLWRSHGHLAERARLNLEIAPVVLSIEAAVPCGLILNELAGNALKHAFPKGCGGEVTVCMEHEASKGTICLKVHDNGVGLPAGLDWRQSSTLGLRLVRILAGQLHGSVETGTGPGAEFQITFSMNEAQS